MIKVILPWLGDMFIGLTMDTKCTKLGFTQTFGNLAWQIQYNFGTLESSPIGYCDMHKTHQYCSCWLSHKVTHKWHVTWTKGGCRKGQFDAFSKCISPTKNSNKCGATIEKDEVYWNIG